MSKAACVLLFFCAACAGNWKEVRRTPLGTIYEPSGEQTLKSQALESGGGFEAVSDQSVMFSLRVVGECEGVATEVERVEVLEERSSAFGSDQRTRTATKRGADSIRAVPCPAAVLEAALPARFEMTTPWGKTVQGAAQSGTVAFTMDWSEALHHENDLKNGWQVRDESGALSTNWSPTDSSLREMVAAIRRHRASGAVVAGSPRLLVKVFELAHGKDLRLMLTLQNRGQGAAKRVSATTQSDNTALHALSFDFGTIAPGQELTRTVAVKPAGDAESVVVVVSFSEAGGFEPASVSGRFKLPGPRICDGKISRTEFDKKKKKLKKLLAKGLLSEEEVAAFELQLVECLKL